MFILTIALLVAGSSVYAQVCKAKDIAYIASTDSEFNPKKHILDVYFAKDTATKKPVFVFIHGGSWKQGTKNTYRLMARHFVKKGFVCVLVNYRLSPETNYKGMANDCAQAMHWVSQNIAKYGGFNIATIFCYVL